ncbi:uncharacterized protein LOC143765216 [Ranitomeya variabilis]|uniref:uncharacterized protein LOC143765216 n=1 Tax=Ranitomeya variabilis TaxID=490064 RepID=UPI004057B9D8
MMKITHVSVLLLLLPLSTLVISASVNINDKGLYNNIIFNIKPGSCPPQRYYIKSEHEVYHRLCVRDTECPGDFKCCLDNGHTICKPPVKEKTGTCPSFTNALSSAEKCNDHCTSDSECPGTFKCCLKTCGRSCVPTLHDMGKPSNGSTARTGFCPQEEISNCAVKERAFCDAPSCLDGYKCCPKICRTECQKTLPERPGGCPTSAPCVFESESNACSSDYDCSPLFKCCAICGNRCVKAQNIPSFLHNGTNTIFLIDGRK